MDNAVIDKEDSSLAMTGVFVYITDAVTTRCERGASTGDGMNRFT
jgi:hypothetical protein